MTQKPFLRLNSKDKAFHLFLMLFMLGVLFATLFPFLNVLAISFNDSADTARGGIGVIPRVLTLDNYRQLARFPSIWRGMFISFARTVIGTATGLFATAMLAYVISRRDFMLRKFVTTMFVLTMYVSGGLIPHFMVIRMFGLNNNFWVYIIPGLISAWNLIIVRSFIDSLPYSLQESAFLDGANDLTIFFKIILPLCLPVLMAVALFIAVSQWNAWFDTYLFAPFNESITTLQFELMKILEGAATGGQLGDAGNIQMAHNVSPLSLRMAATVVTMLPMLIVYPFVQRFFVSGMTLGAVKE